MSGEATKNSPWTTVDQPPQSSVTKRRRMIQLMPTESQQRIVAGQAVSDLASCVKELMDNALDAGSKSINIRLFKKGLDIVEVSDDGHGIPTESRASLALPHATSKIQSFDDIYNDQFTLGFRGEALHSLANISSKLVVATRTSTDAVAQKMEYRRDGTMVEESITDMPRKLGTTVAVLGLLSALPVRRRDLEQRLAHHRTKLLHTVTEYAIFSTGVRVNLMDVVTPTSRGGGGGAKEKTLIATAFNNTRLHETVSSVLGTKYLLGMSPLEIDLTFTLKDCTRQDHAASQQPEPNTTSTGRPWKVTGLIQSAGTFHRDKVKGQYFAINRRPVDLPSVARLLNETFRAFDPRSTPPACVLELTLPGTAYDVNLAPDKRQVVLTYEAEIHAVIQTAIKDIWASQTEGQFTKNMDLTVSTTLIDLEAELTVPSADERDEMGDSSSSCRLFPRRYGFVNDPNQAAVKERDDGQRLVEYESNSPRAKRRKSSSDQQQLQMSRCSDSESITVLEASPMRARRRTAMNCSDDTTTTTEATNNESTESQVEPHEVSWNNMSVSSSVSKADSMEQFQSVTPSSTYRKMMDTGRENRSNMQTANSFNHFSSSLHASITPCSVDEPTSTNRHRSEHLQWQKTQSTFLPSTASDSRAVNRAQLNEDVSTELLIASSSNATQKVAISTETQPPRLKSLSGLERFGFCTAERQAADTTVQTPTPPTGICSNTPQDEFKRSLPNAAAVEQASVTIQVSSNVDAKEKTIVAPFSTPPTRWCSFQGTQAVVMASLSDRIQTLERKRQDQQRSSFEATEDNVHSNFGLVPDLPSTVTLNKDDFKGMTVIGQFNLGFILCRSQNGNLWILDQHACDEKYNFEKLCQETVIREQTLMSPMSLELSPSEEACITDHMDIFRKNGFRFQYDETKPSRHRLSITALPHSGARAGRNAVQYGIDDIIALCGILGAHDADASSSSTMMDVGGGTGTDGTGRYGNNAVRRYAATGTRSDTADNIITRLPKTIAMFASRACRGSIMIGTALSDKEMDKIVQRLADIKHPWNCPHGRPTLRHVCDLQETVASDRRRAAEHIAGPTVTLMSQEAVDDYR